MVEKLIIIVLSLIASIFIYFRIADKYNIIDKPNERSSHSQITLRGGGIVFFFGVIFYFLFFGLQYFYFAIGLTIIVIISFLDDIMTIPSRYRILLHFLAMLLTFVDCGFYSVPWYFTIVALIVATGIINAFNFMDGINGITGSYSFVLIVSFLYINNYITPFVNNSLLYVIILSLSIFNFFNFRINAKCFAGDVGSVSIALIVVFLLGKLIEVNHDFTYIVLLLIYGIDSILTIVHRILLKENIFEAHRMHMYQIMSNELHIPHIYVSLIYAVTQAVVVLGYFVFKNNSLVYLLISTSVLTIIYLAFMKRYFRLHIL